MSPASWKPLIPANKESPTGRFNTPQHTHFKDIQFNHPLPPSPRLRRTDRLRHRDTEERQKQNSVSPVSPMTGGNGWYKNPRSQSQPSPIIASPSPDFGELSRVADLRHPLSFISRAACKPRQDDKPSHVASPCHLGSV